MLISRVTGSQVHSDFTCEDVVQLWDRVFAHHAQDLGFHTQHNQNKRCYHIKKIYTFISKKADTF